MLFGMTIEGKQFLIAGQYRGHLGRSLSVTSGSARRGLGGVGDLGTRRSPRRGLHGGHVLYRHRVRLVNVHVLLVGVGVIVRRIPHFRRRPWASTNEPWIGRRRSKIARSSRLAAW